MSAVQTYTWMITESRRLGDCWKITSPEGTEAMEVSWIKEELSRKDCLYYYVWNNKFNSHEIFS